LELELTLRDRMANRRSPSDRVLERNPRAPAYHRRSASPETLRPYCEEAARARNTTHGTMRAAVENEIQRLPPRGRARAEIVAKALAVSSRTLTRRLVEEGTNFAEVVDGLRRLPETKRWGTAR